MNNESAVKPEIHVGDTLKYVGPIPIYRGGRLKVIAVNDAYVWGVSDDPQFISAPRDKANNILIDRTDFSIIVKVDVPKLPTVTPDVCAELYAIVSIIIGFGIGLLVAYITDLG